MKRTHHIIIIITVFGIQIYVFIVNKVIYVFWPHTNATGWGIECAVCSGNGR